MLKQDSPIPREASLVCYIVLAGLDHGCFRLDMYAKSRLAHPQRGFVREFCRLCQARPRLAPSGDVEKRGSPILREASFVYFLGLAGRDHGWFRLEMYKGGSSPIPREASFVYYVGVAGFYHGWFRLEMYQKRRLAHT